MAVKIIMPKAWAHRIAAVAMMAGGALFGTQAEAAIADTTKGTLLLKNETPNQAARELRADGIYKSGYQLLRENGWKKSAARKYAGRKFKEKVLFVKEWKPASEPAAAKAEEAVMGAKPVRTRSLFASALAEPDLAVRAVRTETIPEVIQVGRTDETPADDTSAASASSANDFTTIGTFVIPPTVYAPDVLTVEQRFELAFQDLEDHTPEKDAKVQEKWQRYSSLLQLNADTSNPDVDAKDLTVREHFMGGPSDDPRLHEFVLAEPETQTLPVEIANAPESEAPDRAPPAVVVEPASAATPLAVETKPAEPITEAPAERSVDIPQPVEKVLPVAPEPSEKAAAETAVESDPIPEPIVIKKGDTLNEIAQKANVSCKALAEFNGIRNYNIIIAGKVLQVEGLDRVENAKAAADCIAKPKSAYAEKNVKSEKRKARKAQRRKLKPSYDAALSRRNDREERRAEQRAEKAERRAALYSGEKIAPCRVVEKPPVFGSCFPKEKELVPISAAYAKVCRNLQFTGKMMQVELDTSPSPKTKRGQRRVKAEYKNLETQGPVFKFP